MNKTRGMQQKFIEFYSQGLTGAESARRAGYAPTNAAGTASRLLKEPAVMEALDKVRNASQAVATYNLEAAMAETDMCIKFAEATKNANAMVKAVELKSKLSGLLVDRHEITAPSFTLNIVGVTKQEPSDVSPEFEQLGEGTDLEN